MHAPLIRVIAAAAVLALAAAAPPVADAHCDTMNGPVVAAARLALDKGDITPVLRWVKAADEPAIRDAFTQTQAVRSAGPQAKALADRYFFETVVRLHRQGEGEPYTGLKPAGAAVEPAIAHADSAVAGGSVDEVLKLVTGDVVEGLQSRFARLKAARAHADHTVEAGRAYVEAYVDFLHYVERVHAAATAASGHAGHADHAAMGPDAAKK